LQGGLNLLFSLVKYLQVQFRLVTKNLHSVFESQIIFAIAKLLEYIRRRCGDLVEKYLRFTSFHDGVQSELSEKCVMFHSRIVISKTYIIIIFGIPIFLDLLKNGSKIVPTGRLKKALTKVGAFFVLVQRDDLESLRYAIAQSVGGLTNSAF